MSESPSQSQSNALPPQLPRPTFTTTEDPLAGESDVLVIGLPESGELSPAGETVDRALGGVLTALIERGQLTGETGELFTQAGPGVQNGEGGGGPMLITVVGIGGEQRHPRGAAFQAASTAVRSLVGRPIKRLVVALGELFPASEGDAVAAGALYALEGQSIYRTKQPIHVPEEIAFVGIAEDQVARGGIIGESVNLTRRLVNEPAAMIYPESFADRATALSEGLNLECEVWDEKRLAEENCRAILAVGAGSDRPPRLVMLRYNGGPEGEAPLAIVGKGVTFDSGGLSIKPSDGMVDMKCDMAGAATVVGAMNAIARLGLKKNVIGFCGLAENMVSGSSYKLGDVIVTRSGKTIEILNTDAEGRVVLSDTLNVAVGEKPSAMIDLATLTGACMVALGNEVAGLMSNDQSVCDALESAADSEAEPVWQLPMFELYDEKVKSKVADIKNIGEGRWGGAITAAKFLEAFVDETPWVHIDIAGPAFADSPKPHRDAGATGALVRTLIRWVESQS